MNETMVWNLFFPLICYGLGLYMGWMMWRQPFLSKAQRLETRYLVHEELHNVLKKIKGKK